MHPLVIAAFVLFGLLVLSWLLGGIRIRVSNTPEPLPDPISDSIAHWRNEDDYWRVLKQRMIADPREGDTIYKDAPDGTPVKYTVAWTDYDRVIFDVEKGRGQRNRSSGSRQYWQRLVATANEWYGDDE